MEDIMCLSQRSEDYEELCGNNGGKDCGSGVFSLLHFLNFTRDGSGNELPQTQQTGLQERPYSIRPGNIILQEKGSHEPGLCDPGWPKLREPGLEAAVDGLIRAFEKHIEGLPGN
jgi:hypothetical protein